MSAAKKDATVNRVMPGIQSFAWSADRSRCAVCPQSNEILIFDTNNKPNISDWRLLEVLREVSDRGLFVKLTLLCLYHSITVM